MKTWGIVLFDKKKDSQIHLPSLLSTQHFSKMLG